MKKEMILVPTDFSKLSSVAVDYAFRMAKRLGAKMLFLHVVDLNQAPGEMAALYQEAYLLSKEKAEALLGDLVQRATRLGIQSEAKRAEGSPFVEIIQTAKKLQADLIIMGTHGRTGLSHMMMGSQAERVVRQAACPVLTVKSPTHLFVPV